MNTKYIKPALLLFIISAFPFFASGVQNEKAKANFIYNFAKNVTWPSSQGDFIITVFGNNDVAAELRILTVNRLLGTQKIQVKNENSVNEIDKCHILFVPKDKSAWIPQLITLVQNKNVLLVTEEYSCSQGAGINLIQIEEKLSFEISQHNIESCGLKVSSKLVQLGKKPK